MFFGNAQLLERTLHNDLNELIKSVRTRQDQHLALLQYNKALVAKLLEMDSIPFLQEEIKKHRTYFQSFQQKHQALKKEGQQLLQKYQMVISGEQNVTKLMSRVTARVLEICLSSLDKSKSYDPYLLPKYHQLKQYLQIPQEQIQIHTTLSTIIRYAEDKNMKQIDRLSQILQILIDGDFQNLGRIYQPSEPDSQLLPKNQSSPLMGEQKKIQPSSKNKPDEVKEKIEEAEKIKKEKSKLIARMLNNLYNTLDISKPHFNEIMLFSDEEDHRKKLYGEIMTRNKVNHDQILKFQSQKQSFHKKVKKFKQIMQFESRKIAEALLEIQTHQTEIHEEKKKDQSQNGKHLQCKSEASEKQEAVEMPEKQSFFNFKRIDRRTRKVPSPGFIKNLISTSMNCTMNCTQQKGFQHIRFDSNEEMFGKINRVKAKLPQISGRSFLESRYDKQREPQRGQSDLKDDKRINIAKNIQINMVRRSITKNSALAYQSNRRSPQGRSPGALDHIQGGGFDFTFYNSKKGNKRLNETYSNNFVL